MDCSNATKVVVDEVIWSPLPSLVEAEVPLDKSIFLYYSSQGGIVSLAPERADSFRKLALSLKEKGVQLNVVIRTWCESSCTMVLANLNQMAGEGLINLAVDSDVTISFHGAHSFETGKIVPGGNKMMWDAYLKNGDIGRPMVLIVPLSLFSPSSDISMIGIFV